MRVARGARGRAGLLAGCLLGACAAGAPGAARAQEAANEGAKATGPGEGQAEAGEGKAGEEEGPARPPLPPAPPSRRLPWGRHIEIGGDVALVARPASTLANGTASGVRYRPVIGYGVHARWELLRVLRFSAYFVDADHDLQIPPGALDVPDEVVAGPREVVAEPVETIAFGARFAPTLPLGERARAWVSAGIGWGRFSFGRMDISEPGAAGSYKIRERSMSFAEVPIGLGASFDLIRNWLTVEVEVSGAFTFGQGGEALEEAQAIDAAGRRRSIGALPVIDGSFVQTLGLSLVL